MYRFMLCLSATIILLASCQSDPTSTQLSEEVFVDIPADLQPYFVSFEREARAYGLDIDYEAAQVTAEIHYIDSGAVAGTCTTNGHTLRHIVIDQAFWDRASYLLREMVIYHELGHCVLGRGHEEGTFDSGICRSIMRSGLGQCRDAYTVSNRDYFVSELFASSE